MIYRWVVALYPQAWRERYEEEFLALLEQCPPSLLGLADLILGALDARLHTNAILGRMLSMLQRLRSTTITVFCCYIAFVVAGIGYQKLTEYDDFMQAASDHPAIGIAFHTIQYVSAIALLAVLAGGLPIAFAVVRQAIAARRWRLLLLFAVPPLALALIFGHGAVLHFFVGAPHQVSTSADHLAFLSLVGMFILGAIASTAAVALAVRQSEISPRLFQFARIPTLVATLSMALMFLAALVWGLALRAEAPDLFSGNDGIVATSTALSWLSIVLVMGAATAIAAVSTARGLPARPANDTSQAVAGQNA